MEAFQSGTKQVVTIVADKISSSLSDLSQYTASSFPSVFSEVDQLLSANADDTNAAFATFIAFFTMFLLLTFAQLAVRAQLRYCCNFDWFNQNTFVRLVLILFPSIHTLPAHRVMKFESNKNRKHRPKSILMTPAKRLHETVQASSFSEVDIFEPSHSTNDFFVIVLLSLKFSLHLPKTMLENVNILLSIFLSFRIVSPLSNSTADLLFDLFHIANLESTMTLQSVSRFKVITTSTRWLILVLWFAFVLNKMGHSDFGAKILGGFGYTSLIVGWSLQQILSDVIASFSLAFDNNFSTGDKIVVFGEEGVVASMGMRSTKITLTYSGEELCMPNSKVASEIVKTYSVFKERRAELEFVISKDTENVKLLAICDHVGEAIQTISDMGHNVRPSNPKVYFTSITPLGLKYVLLFYVTDYNDDVSKYKSAVSDALLQIVLILRKLEVDLIAAPAGVVAT